MTALSLPLQIRAAMEALFLWATKREPGLLLRELPTISIAKLNLDVVDIRGSGCRRVRCGRRGYVRRWLPSGSSTSSRCRRHRAASRHREDDVDTVVDRTKIEKGGQRFIRSRRHR